MAPLFLTRAKDTAQAGKWYRSIIDGHAATSRQKLTQCALISALTVRHHASLYTRIKTRDSGRRQAMI